MVYSGDDALRFAEDSLVKVAVDDVNWEKLYQSRADGSFWLMTYPESELHGGGPPRLERIDEAAAQSFLVCLRGEAS